MWKRVGKYLVEQALIFFYIENLIYTYLPNCCQKFA